MQIPTCAYSIADKLYLNVTGRRTLRCAFCPRHTGEPTLRLKRVLEVSDYIRNLGGRVRTNTDGLANLAHKRNVLPEFAGRIDALPVSIDAHNEALYNQHCRPALAGSFRAMLDFLEQATRYVGAVTATAIDGLEGVDIEACRQLAEARNVAFRRRTLGVAG